MKQGKVVFIGEPNVGKSSLLNALVGESVSIVTDMAGTTRESVQGYLTGPDWRIIFLDTPGMDKKFTGKTRDTLTKYMGKSISGSVAEADILCYVLNAIDIRDEYIKKIENLALKPGKPIIVAVNKVDKTDFQKLYPLLAKLNKLGCVVVPTSCKDFKNLDILVQEIIKLLPESENETDTYEEGEYTDQSVKKMCAEIIRGELIKNLRMEIPHGIAVNIKTFTETKKEIDIDAEIYCAKPSHKPIIIGKRGAVLKAVGSAARKKINDFTGKHIRLNTHVFVRENWREKDVKKYLNPND